MSPASICLHESDPKQKYPSSELASRTALRSGVFFLATATARQAEDVIADVAAALESAYVMPPHLLRQGTLWVALAAWQRGAMISSFTLDTQYRMACGLFDMPLEIVYSRIKERFAYGDTTALQSHPLAVGIESWVVKEYGLKSEAGKTMPVFRRP
ncbi:Uncharacterized protein TPAR_03824 [Tolypocladium paradoxum]|uniref:Uncharacterized protein n=1 Tax=Tolypocladium paradoxum TaxID=94208 RepID=A0A2S4L0K3_9HYPO|nr:Uncharacterized protein TPAR_03824 [Tolypocladium paradoxum]